MTANNNFIIEDEFSFLKIGTAHNKKRALKVMSNMIKNPGKSIFSQSATRSDAKAAYQFLNNENLDMDELANMHRFRTIERIVETGKPILLPQDTTYAIYHTQEKDGMSKTHDKAKGVKLHNCIAITPEGLNLGLMYQKSFGNDLSEEEFLSDYERKSRPIEDKESYRWIESFIESSIYIPHDIDVTVISDREGDIYEYMSVVVSHKRHFLTRIAQNRMTDDSQRILDSIQKEQSQGTICVQVPRDSKNKEKKRDAILEVRFKEYKIKSPKILSKNKKLPKSLTVWVVHTKEVNPPAGIKPIEWFLMTNRTIKNFDEAVEQIKNYTQRWKIERFHYVLKTGGCNIEKIQARSM